MAGLYVTINLLGGADVRYPPRSLVWASDQVTQPAHLG